MDQLKFIMVGHVDHGKSTLIGRLFFDTDSLPPDKIEEIKQTSKELGREIEFSFLMDHLQEEREQGITIDTAQTFFKTDKREYVIIDAPGHVEFVKNMITGASQAEAGVIIVDATEGVQEQTKRHSYILSMLGLDQIIVLINKMDISNYSEEVYNNIKKDIIDFLDSINLKSQYFIPISATKGDNVAIQSDKMKWYNGPTVLTALDSFKNKIISEDNAPIFPVQDIYKVDDKRIIVGRLESGTLKTGDTIKILPTEETTTIKSIEKFLEKNVIKVSAGESIGITTSDPVFLNRGNVICKPDEEPKLTDTFYANIFWLSKKNFNIDDKFPVRCATQEVNCKIKKILKRMNSSSLEIIEENAKTLKNLEVGEVIIKTKNPISVKLFNETPELGRFVLVQGENVTAGGIITKIIL